jgi:hypothetical protein
MGTLTLSNPFFMDYVSRIETVRARMCVNYHAVGSSGILVFGS